MERNFILIITNISMKNVLAGNFTHREVKQLIAITIIIYYHYHYYYSHTAALIMTVLLACMVFY